jgi:Skp family chaperone for outer membrane proteins
MKKIFLIGVILFFTTTTYAQIAYVSIDSVYAVVPNYKEKLQRLKETATTYREEIAKSRKLNQEKLNQLVGPYNAQTNEAFDKIKLRMKDTDALQLDLLIDEDNAVTKKEEYYNKIIQLEYDKEIKPKVEMVNLVISNYAKSKKLDAIYILEQLKPALQYLNPEKNITQAIIAAIKKERKN